MNTITLAEIRQKLLNRYIIGGQTFICPAEIEQVHMFEAERLREQRDEFEKLVLQFVPWQPISELDYSTKKNILVKIDRDGFRGVGVCMLENGDIIDIRDYYKIHSPLITHFCYLEEGWRTKNSN